MSALPLADGPAMYLGGSIMTFALPYAAFILIATGLFFLFRAKHRGPRLKYLSPGAVASVGTREPGPVPAPAAKAPATPMDAAAASESDIMVPPSVHPEAEVDEAKAEGQAIDAETEGTE